MEYSKWMWTPVVAYWTAVVVIFLLLVWSVKKGWRKDSSEKEMSDEDNEY